MAEKFSDVLEESRRTQEQLKNAKKKTDLFKTAKGLFLMPQCITEPLKDYYDGRRDLEGLKGAFADKSDVVSSNEQSKLGDILRGAATHKKEGRSGILNAKKALQKEMRSARGTCQDKSCPYRRKCPVANKAKIDTMIDILALCRMSFPEKQDIINRLRSQTPTCFRYHIPASSIDVLNREHEIRNTSDNTLQDMFDTIINGKPATGSSFAEVLNREITERTKEGTSVLLARLYECDVFSLEVASVGNNPMHYKYSPTPSIIWNGTDERLLRSLRTYAVNCGGIAAEPYRYMNGETKEYGLMIWCGYKVFIPDKYVYLLANIIQNYPVVTSYCAALTAYLRFPRKGKIFKNYEGDKTRHARLKLDVSKIESIVRLSGADIKADSVYTAVTGILLEEFEKQIEEERPRTLYDLMPYYVPYYNIRKSESCSDRYKRGILFDRLAGCSFFLPDRNFMARDTDFSLNCLNAYDFSENTPKKEDGKYVPAKTFPECAYYILRGDEKTIESIFENMTAKDYMARYDLHMFYYGSTKEEAMIGFISPALLYEQCLDIITQSAFISSSGRRYNLYCGKFDI